MRAHLRPRGLSRARNAALDQRRGGRRRVPRRRLRLPAGTARSASPSGSPATHALDGLTGRAARRVGQLVRVLATPTRRSSTDDNLWNRAISFTIFLRRGVVERSAPSTSGSGSARASRGRRARRSTTSSARSARRADRVRPGARRAARRPRGRRPRSASATARASATSSASTATRPRVVGRMLVRPVGGALVALVRLDGDGRALPARDAARPRARLPRREALEDLRVTLEPRLEREALDRPRARRRRVARQVVEHARRRRRRAPRVPAARRAPTCRDAGTPIPPSSPTSSTVPPLAGWTTGSPQAIASTTSVGHGSFTFVCRSTCARRKIAGASRWSYAAERGGRARRGRARRASGSSGLTSRPVTRSCASG